MLSVICLSKTDRPTHTARSRTSTPSHKHIRVAHITNTLAISPSLDPNGMDFSALTRHVTRLCPLSRLGPFNRSYSWRGTKYDNISYNNYLKLVCEIRRDKVFLVLKHTNYLSTRNIFKSYVWLHQKFFDTRLNFDVTLGNLRFKHFSFRLLVCWGGMRILP